MLLLIPQVTQIDKQVCVTNTKQSLSTVFVTLGLLLGPMFPTTISLASKALPRSYHATSIGFMAA